MDQLWQAVSVVIPILFVLVLGYAASKAKAFPGGSIGVLNELVLNFALPASLFVGTLSVSREVLLKEGGILLVMLLTLVVGYGVVIALSMLVLRHALGHAAIQALAVTFAAGPFYGPALLDGLFDAKTGPGVSISMISILLNLIIVPLTTVLLEVARQRGTLDAAPNGPAASKGPAEPAAPSASSAPAAPSAVNLPRLIGRSFFKAVFKTPFVWAPLVALVLVLVGVDMPAVVDSSLTLIGSTTAGVAIFVSGLTLGVNKLAITWETVLNVALKNLGLPALFFGIAVAMGIASGVPFEQGLLLVALPTGPMSVLLATRYKTYEREASSTLALSTVTMIVTVTALILILGL